MMWVQLTHLLSRLTYIAHLFSVNNNNKLKMQTDGMIARMQVITGGSRNRHAEGR
jgi:hypothetical protein